MPMLAEFLEDVSQTTGLGGQRRAFSEGSMFRIPSNSMRSDPKNTIL
jgi:hypothetical protein